MKTQTGTQTVSLRGAIPLWAFLHMNEGVVLTRDYYPYGRGGPNEIVFPRGTRGVLRGLEKTNDQESHALVVFHGDESVPWDIPFGSLDLV